MWARVLPGSLECILGWSCAVGAQLRETERKGPHSCQAFLFPNRQHTALLGPCTGATSTDSEVEVRAWKEDCLLTSCLLGDLGRAFVPPGGCVLTWKTEVI